jgi:HlyD family secretion protein
MNWKIWLVVVLLALGGAAGAWYGFGGSSSAAQYRTAKVEKGDLVVTVTASGTVQPVTQVQVGTQVSGVIQKLSVDFNSRVKAGDVVAQIDPAPFKARADQDRANLARSEADVTRVKAGLVQAEKELARSRELAKRELISPSDLDAAIATHDSLAAQVQVAEAVVVQSRAALEVSEVNLRYTTIVSPIDGIVISRDVDVGQTVAASLSAPTLFVIAESLKRVQIQASVAEADVGRVAVGQPVSFTVDAHRDRVFSGNVSQIRLAPVTVQNVVTYTVMIDADNPEEKLWPGMTASVTVEIDRRLGALKVPNSALRFMPPEAAADPTPSGRGRGRDRTQRLWVPQGGGLRAVEIKAGATDGAFTEILKGDLQPGADVVVGLRQAGDAPGMNNPFAPARPQGGRGR